MAQATMNTQIPAMGDDTRIQDCERALEETYVTKRNLETLLDSANQRCEKLEKELEILRLRVRPDWINSCPAEVLSMIFLKATDGEPRLNPNLMRVCKVWHSHVLRDPNLWRKIRINASFKLDMQQWAERTVNFVDTCVERSGAMSLDIEFDASYLRTERDAILEILGRGCRTYQEWPSQELQYMVIGQLDAIDVEEMLDYAKLNHRLCPTHVTSVLDALIGPGGVNMRRWESLCISMPHEQLYGIAGALWSSLEYPAPQLTQLSVTCSDASETFKDYGPLVLDVSAVRELDLSAFQDWTYLALEANVLQSLTIYPCLHQRICESISPFIHLRFLRLLESDDERSLTEKSEINFRAVEGLVSKEGQLASTNITLPELEEFQLSGRFRGRSFERLILPKLQVLKFEAGFVDTLHSGGRLYSSRRLRDQALRITILWPTWINDRDDWDDTLDEAEIIHDLFSEDSSSSKTELIEFADWDPELVGGILRPVLAASLERNEKDMALKYISFLKHGKPISKVIEISQFVGAN